MITCSNCNHQNPEGSVQCESCYTPLPSSSPCPNCGALVQTSAVFCGQCGFNLQVEQGGSTQNQNSNLAVEDPNSDFFLEEDSIPTSINANTFNIPWDSPEEEIENLSKIDDKQITFDEFMQLTSDDVSSEPAEQEAEPTIGQEEDLSADLNESDDLESWISSLQEESEKPKQGEAEAFPQEIIEEIPDDVSVSDDLNFADEASASQIDIPDVTSSNFAQTEPTVEMPTGAFTADPISNEETNSENLEPIENKVEAVAVSEAEASLDNEIEKEEEIVTSSSTQVSEPEASSDNVLAVVDGAQTKLQLQRTVLYHLQTKTEIEIPLNLVLIRIGKPTQQVYPDVDVSGFPNAEVVSRVHAHIRVEGDAYFLEDMGSSNGTYINHSPLPTGNRHRLRSGDRFSLGKGDLMTFIFQLEGSL